MQYAPEYHRPPVIVVYSPIIDVLRQISNGNYREYLFREQPSNLSAFAAQHTRMCQVLRQQGVQILDVASLTLPEPVVACIRQSPNIFFTRDSAICLPHGGIILRMATAERSREPTVMEAVYKILGVPILARVPEGITLEGGDIIFARENCVFAGYGPRTSLTGVEYFRNILSQTGGPVEEVLALNVSPERINLDGVLMPLSPSLLLADMSALDRHAILFRGSERRTVDLRAYLHARGYEVLEIPRSEGYMLATNLVHLGGRQIMAYEHNERVNAQLESVGYSVLSICGDELIKGSGGPRCMTNVIRYPISIKRNWS